MADLLQIKNLHVHYSSEDERVLAVNGIHLSLKQGENLGLVGETGAGKTSTAMAIMQLIPSPPGEILAGEIFFEDKNLMALSEAEKRAYRGSEISMIFQDPMTALNPVYPIGYQIAESIKWHLKTSWKEARRQAEAMLEVVGIEASRYADYPHQFSGGMKQRAIIAMALALQPKLLIADEPTTALDVTIQAQVLELMAELKRRYQTSLLMITHDLGVIAETCERVAVMYAGQIVEQGPIAAVFEATKHPYTKGLFDSIPKLEQRVRRLTMIEGAIPDPSKLPSGCPFHPRCRYAKARCAKEAPEAQGDVHEVRCHYPLGEKEEDRCSHLC